MTQRFLIILFCGITAFLAACAPPQQIDKSDYWARINAKESTLMEDPKAQQALYRDISRCSVEVSEIERLESLRDRMCTEHDDMNDEEEKDETDPTLEGMAVPEKEAPILTENSNYKDFETCMKVRGWARMEHRPYDMSKSDRDDYVDAIAHQRYRSKIGECLTKEGEPCSPAEDNRGYVGYEDYVGYEKER